jgi:hypothetical protein
VVQTATRGTIHLERDLVHARFLDEPVFRRFSHAAETITAMQAPHSPDVFGRANFRGSAIVTNEPVQIVDDTSWPDILQTRPRISMVDSTRYRCIGS